MVDKNKKYTKKYFLLLIASIFSVMLFACLFDQGTITRVDKSEIHSDPNKFPVQLVKKEKNFEIELSNTTKRYKNAKQIELALGTHGESGINANIVFNTKEAGTFYFKGCINDNEYICLQKGPKSDNLSCNTLFITSGRLKNCALWATTSKDKISHNWKIKSEEVVYYPFVYFLDHPKKVYKIYEKIAYLWDIKPRSILIFVSVIILMILLSSWKIRKGKIKYFALIIFSLMMLISLFFPPFKHADEPQHFISFLNITQQSEKVNKVEHTAKKTHFSRLLFNEKEKFTSKDINYPSDECFPKRVESSEIQTRSLITPFFWKLYAFFIKNFSVVHQLLLLRIFHSLIFSLVILFIINKNSFQFIIIISCIPTLLCVSNSVSNYIFSISISLLIINFLLISNEISRFKIYIIYALLSVLSFESISFIFIVPFLLLYDNRIKFFKLGILLYTLITIFLYLINSETFASIKNSLYSNNLLIFIIFLSLIFIASFIHSKIRLINFKEFKKKYFFNLHAIMVLSFVMYLILPLSYTFDIEAKNTNFSEFIVNLGMVLITWFRFDSPDYLTQTTLFLGLGWLDFSDNNLPIIINFFIFFMIPFSQKFSSNYTLSKFDIFQINYLAISSLLLITSLYIVKMNPHGRYLLIYFICAIFIFFKYSKRFHNFNFINQYFNDISATFFFFIYILVIDSCFNRYY